MARMSVVSALNYSQMHWLRGKFTISNKMVEFTDQMTDLFQRKNMVYLALQRSKNMVYTLEFLKVNGLFGSFWFRTCTLIFCINCPKEKDTRSES